MKQIEKKILSSLLVICCLSSFQINVPKMHASNAGNRETDSALGEYDTVYEDDFSNTISETVWNSWNSESKGTWQTVDGELVNKQYGLEKAISCVEYLPFYGELYSVEADVQLTNITGYASIMSCVSDVGFYHARISKVKSGTSGTGGVVQLFKYTDGHELLDEYVVTSLQTDEWYKLRLDTVDGMLTVYLDDEQVIKYDDSASQDYMTTGTFGFRSVYGEMKYDNLCVKGKELETYTPQIEPTSYSDSFDDEIPGNDPSHWIEENDSDKWKVQEKSGNLVYGTDSTDYTYTWLHTFESDPEITVDFMVEKASKDGRFEFLTRYTQEKYSYAGIGYDFSTSKWYIYTARGEDFEPRKIYADTAFNLESEKWYTIQIIEDDVNIKVYVDEELVVEDSDAYMTGYGRIGILSENTNIYIDNLSYTMPNGGNVTDGVMEYVFDYDSYGMMSHLEIESLGGNTLIGVNEGRRFISYDNGSSWSKNLTDQYTDVKGAGLGYPSILELSEGVHLMVYADTFEVYKSTDYMKNWTKVGQIIPDVGDNKTDSGLWKNIIHVNALTKVDLEDGTERIFLSVGMRRFNEEGKTVGHYARVFYSDDEGVTWKQSANDTRDITPNYTEDSSVFFSWTEAKIIKCSDGSLRMYNSRQYDCIVYTESFDGGVTWEGFYSVPYLQNGQTSYSIAEDPENPGTYYMVCINAKARNYNSAFPRNRLSLVKSTDGKNWEFVMDIERFSSYRNYLSSELYQIIDPSISIIDGYIYVTMGRSYAYEANTTHNRQIVLLERLEMDKLPNTTGWNDGNLADSTRPESIEIDTMPCTVYALGDTFSIDGGSVKMTAFNGQVTYRDLKRFIMVTDEPEMSVKGTYTISFMNIYAQSVSYDVRVTDYHYWFFTEDFAGTKEELESTGWNGTALKYFNLQKDSNGNNVELVSNYSNNADGTEKVCLNKYLYLDGNKEAEHWSDYIVEADVVLTDTPVDATCPIGRRAGILAAADVDTDSCYEFRLIYYTDNRDNPYRWELMKRSNGTNKLVKYGVYQFDFNTAYTLKLMLEGNAIRCYINDQQVYEKEDSAILTGTIGLQATGNVCRFDHIRVYTETEEDSYNVSFYRKGCIDENGNYINIHPFKEGYVFGGWYTDEEYMMPLGADVTEGKAYVRWVDEKVLTVKAQLSTDMYQEKIPEKTRMRLVTSVDKNENYDYQNVGFKISTPKFSREYSTTTVFRKITAKDATLTFEYTPGDVFGTDEAAYFATMILINLDTSELDKVFIITAFWTTEDGTKVYGEARRLTMRQGIQ